MRRLARALASRPFPWVVLAYTLIALAVTDPLVRRLGTSLPSDAVDPALNTWIVWWNAQAMPLTRGWWNAPIFHPSPGSLALSEHLLGLAPLTTPLQWLGCGPVAAYNTALFLSFPLCAIAAYLLGLELTGRRDAAFLGGLVFGFAPLRIAQLGHIQVLTAYWMPIALLGLHRYVRTGRRRDLALFAVAWLLQALANGYYLFYIPLLVALWVAFFLRGRAERRRLGGVLVAGAAVGACLLPLLLLYRSTHEALGLERSTEEIQSFSADVTSFVTSSRRLAWRGMAVEWHGEGELFPGRTVTALVALPVLAAALAGGLRWRRPRRWQWAALGAAVTLSLVAVTPLVFGPWRLMLNEHRLVSVGAPHKPFGLALLALSVFLAGTAPVVRAWRSRSPLAFYLLAAVLLAVFCLGPSAHAFGEPVWYAAPYRWLMLLPGFSSLRVPTRFAMPLMLALSAAGALAFARMAAPGRSSRAWALVCAVGIVADGWVHELPLVAAPARSALLERDLERSVPVLELPMPDLRTDQMAALSADTAAMFRSMYHRHPVVNGYSGYLPPHYAALSMGLEQGDEDVLDALTSRGPLDVRVDETAPGGAEWIRALGARAGAIRLGGAPGETLFRLAARPPGPSECTRTVSPRVVRAAPNPELAALAHDGDWRTRWPSAAQDGSEEVVVELADATDVSGLWLGLSRYPTDYPRELIVETSLDGITWRQAWRGRMAGEMVRAALADPLHIPLRISWPARPLRQIRLRQVGSDPVFYFSIVEMAVCAPAARPALQALSKAPAL